MATMQVQGVKMVPQPTDGVCWYACSKMLYNYSRDNGGTSKDPAADPITQVRYDANGDWASDNAALLARTLNFGYHNDFPMDYDTMWYYLTVYGPIWTSIQKNWGGNNYGHVVVMAGCRTGANGGIYIMDPEPMKNGSKFWLTWAQMNKGLKGLSSCDYQFLTVKG